MSDSKGQDFSTHLASYSNNLKNGIPRPLRQCWPLELERNFWKCLTWSHSYSVWQGESSRFEELFEWFPEFIVRQGILDHVMFEVLPAVNAVILVGSLTSEGLSRRAIDLDLGTVRVPANQSCRNKDLAGTNRHQGRLSPGRRQHLSSEIWVQKWDITRRRMQDKMLFHSWMCWSPWNQD